MRCATLQILQRGASHRIPYKQNLANDWMKRSVFDIRLKIYYERALSIYGGYVKIDGNDWVHLTFSSRGPSYGPYGLLRARLG